MIKGKKGFTLIELLIVVAIIGLLSAVVLVSLNSARRSANDAKRKADLKQIANAMEMYYDTNSTYPTVASPGGCTVASCANTTCTTAVWTTLGTSLNPWLSSLPNDPINSTTYCYQVITAAASLNKFCLVAANLQVPSLGYYVAHNGAGLTTTAGASGCPNW